MFPIHLALLSNQYAKISTSELRLKLCASHEYSALIYYLISAEKYKTSNPDRSYVLATFIAHIFFLISEEKYKALNPGRSYVLSTDIFTELKNHINILNIFFINPLTFKYEKSCQTKI